MQGCDWFLNQMWIIVFVKDITVDLGCFQVTSIVYKCVPLDLKASRILFLNENHPIMCEFICLQYMVFIQ